MPTAALANAELSVMELLWDHGAMTARQVQDKLYGASDRSQHGTVQRLLQRLVDKDLVRREQTAHANTFSACISRAEYAGGQLKTLAERLTGGSIAPLLSHLIDQKRLSRDELRRLRDLLDGGKP
ncbi:MAG: BlaI/MecI/CopY family transcriptional regulator [Lysobacteraceae bacterium]|jgi:predicted transcriptional regulator